MSNYEGHEEVKFSLDTELQQSETDPVWLKVILRNLFRNAIDFRRSDAPAWCKTSIVRINSHWEISVKDNGEGMSAEVREKAFDMFYRGSLRSKGSGMGLYTVRKMVERLGGRTTLESEENGGSELRFTIPAPARHVQ